MRKIFVAAFLALVLISPCMAAINDYNSSLVLLLHMNQTPSTPTYFNDSSVKNHKMVTVGGATTNTSQKVFGNASGWFDGGGDYIKGDGSTDFVFGTGNFTVMMWVRRVGTGTQILYDHRTAATSVTPVIWISGTSNISYYVNGSNVISGAYTIPANAWVQVALIRESGSTKLYVNGTQNGSTYADTNNYVANASAPFIGVDASLGTTGYFTGHVDELAVWKGVAVPITDLYPQASEISGYVPPSGTTLNASFTDSSNPSVVGQAVTFTDTSTGSPTTWNWSIGGPGVTNTTQNAAYTFDTAGDYPVLLNVTNSTGEFNVSGITHTVVNASGYTPQDVWMEGQYNRTFHITSSSDGTPLAANYITSDGQSGTASTLGYAFVTEGFGVYTITVSMTGYATKTVSFVVDEDGTTEIQLTPATSTSKNTNIIYTPHQVRVYTVDAYGVPLIGTNITINYIASTLPSTDTNWLINAYGIDASVAADMVNSSVAMTGISGDDGSNTFTLFGSLTYGITLTNATVGANCYKKLAPIDASYRIYCPITGQTAVNNTLTAVNTSKLVFYKLNTSSYYNLSMIYEDQTGYTTNLSFNVYDYSAGRTLVYTKNWTGIGTAQIVDNYTVYIPLGKEYQWQYNATKV